MESEIETLLHQISDGRFADDRRHAMAQLKDILHDNPMVRRRRLGLGLGLAPR